MAHKATITISQAKKIKKTGTLVKTKYSHYWKMERFGRMTDVNIYDGEIDGYIEALNGVQKQVSFGLKMSSTARDILF